MTRPLALVTGASTGIGFELATLAAQQGHDLVVVANEPEIRSAAAKLARLGVDVQWAQADLASTDAIDRLLDAVAGRPIHTLAANAGTGQGGAFLDQPADTWRHTIETNVTGTLYLLQRVLRHMVARGQGRVLVTGSIVGYIPGTFNATYNATKAFIDNFTEALRNELQDHDGITLTTLMPGATDTPFFARAGMMDTRIANSPKADPARVARDGWHAMLAGKGHVVSGLLNKAQVAATGVVPQSVLAAMHRKVAEPGGAR